MSRVLPPLSIYVHLPWCVSKCPYCDFNSHTAGAAPATDRYVAALCRDLANEIPRSYGRTVASIFIGGGTPSLFAPAQIATIVTAIRDGFDVADDVEITMEANPGTVERGRLSDYRDAGVNRLSLGVQSFAGEMLQTLGRIHGPDEAIAAVGEALGAGFDSVNIDLMFALPGQSVADAQADLDQALALAPGHLSYYQLTLEPNTVFFAHPPAQLPDDELSFDIQEAGHARLRAAGYGQYEVSAFARAGEECRHNLNYWSFGDYLGAGAGAHGKFTDPHGGIWRTVKPAHPGSYMRSLEDAVDAPPRRLDPADLGFEYMLNALRLLDGFRAADFEALTGLTFDQVRADVESARDDGLLEESAPDHWRPTALGNRFLNDLQARFLPSSGAASADGAGSTREGVMHKAGAEPFITG